MNLNTDWLSSSPPGKRAHQAGCQWSAGDPTTAPGSGPPASFQIACWSLLEGSEEGLLLPQLSVLPCEEDNQRHDQKPKASGKSILSNATSAFSKLCATGGTLMTFTLLFDWRKSTALSFPGCLLGISLSAWINRNYCLAEAIGSFYIFLKKRARHSFKRSLKHWRKPLEL